MKIKEGFKLRTVGGEHVVVAIGPASSLLNGIIKLNDTGAYLWTLLQEDREKSGLAKILAAEYEIPVEQAERDVDMFLEMLGGVDCIE